MVIQKVLKYASGWFAVLLQCILVPGVSGAQTLAAKGLQAPDFGIEQTPTAKGKLEIRAIAPRGHHFNLNAPMYFEWLGAGGSAPTRIEPLKKSALKLEFNVDSQNSARRYKISAYLCDDKETYCERHSVEKIAPASVASKDGASPEQPKVASGETPSAKSAEQPAHEHVSGFIVNDPQAAFKKARAQDRLVMIDFFGIWCPPCNELDEHVFSAPGFLKQTASFVRLKLDVDSPVSWSLKSKYAIQGYPTVIFATPEGDEVGRIVGFRPLATFLADARRAADNRDASYSKLRVRADRGDTVAAAKLGLMEYDRAGWADAKKYLTLSGETRKYGEQIVESEIGLLQEQIDGRSDAAKGAAPLEAQMIELLQRSIREFPDTPDSIDRRMQLAGIYGDRKDTANQKETLDDAIRAAHQLMKHPAKLQDKDCTVGDLWESIGEAYESAGDATNARQAYRSGAQEFRSLMETGTERGYSLELAACLWRSGDVGGAEAVYRKFEKLYPDEFTFYFNHARMYHALDNNSEARKLAETAYGHSYGDNKLRSGKLLADILESQGKKDEAVAVARKALAEVQLPKDASLRAHRYAKELKDLVARLSKA